MICIFQACKNFFRHAKTFSGMQKLFEAWEKNWFRHAPCRHAFPFFGHAQNFLRHAKKFLGHSFCSKSGMQKFFSGMQIFFLGMQKSFSGMRFPTTLINSSVITLLKDIYIRMTWRKMNKNRPTAQIYVKYATTILSISLESSDATATSISQPLTNSCLVRTTRRPHQTALDALRLQRAPSVENETATVTRAA